MESKDFLCEGSKLIRYLGEGEDVVVPEGITEIEFCAFALFKKLTYNPQSKIRIENNFSHNYNLVSIEIPDSVVDIGSGAFIDCTSLKSIKMPKGITSIAENLFKGCTSLNTIDLPESIIEINKEAFYNCESLTSIQLPKSLKVLGERVFFNCKSLTSIILPDSLTNIGDLAFCNCENLASIKIPESVINIGVGAFSNCKNLTTIELPQNVTEIGSDTFSGCESLSSINIPESVTKIGIEAFGECKNLCSLTIPVGTIFNSNTFYNKDFKYIYLTQDGKNFLFTNSIDEKLEKTSHKWDFSSEIVEKFSNLNYRKNLIQTYKWKDEGKIKFIPPEYTLENFPTSEIDKYFVNKNNQRWGKLVKALGFDSLTGLEKNNSLIDLMKIYYAIGGFSENQGESERAYDYILKYVAKTSDPNASPQEIGAEIHTRFSKLELKGPYNKTFAQFFIKYYKDDPDFMKFVLDDDFSIVYNLFNGKLDYLCDAHNNFKNILKNYPNRVVNGNEERSLLTPKFVAEHSRDIYYEDINEGNEALAEMIRKYGYSQYQFEHIQEVYEKAKTLKDKYVIMADKANESDTVKFRILEKDDPLGFVLGDITNCCQHIGGIGGSCVDDGYTNPLAGFLVFEESILDKNGKLTGQTRILGQAYVWYDPATKTVCYDNIEIPTLILNELRSGDKHGRSLSSKALLDAVENSAEAIMSAMNRQGIEVERVTTGESYNDLKNELASRFEKENNPIAKHRNYTGYSDATHAQYIIKSYERVTRAKVNKLKIRTKQTKNDFVDNQNQMFEEEPEL